MKVLQLFDFVSPQGGGVPAVVYDLSKTLASRGHDVSIYTCDHLYDKEYLDSLKGVKVSVFKTWLKLSMFFITPGVIFKSMKELKQFDLIHFHCYRSFQNAVVAYYARKYGVPYIFDTHGTLPRLFGKRFFKMIYDHLVGYRMLRGASHFIAETDLGRKEYIEYGARPEQVSMLFHPVDTDAFERLPEKGLFRKKWGITESKIVSYLGRLHEIKGPDFLIDAFSEILKVDSDVRLVMIGPDDRFREKLEEQIDRLGIRDKVLFTGYLGFKDKVSALVDSDVLAQPSKYENTLAWSTMEAILCNVPIVACNNTGASEDLRKMGGGALVDYGDVKGLAAAISKIFDDPAAAQKDTQRQKEYIIRNWSIKSRISDYEAIYKKAIETGKNK